MNYLRRTLTCMLLILALVGTTRAEKAESQVTNEESVTAWKIGKPIVTYWAGPGYFSTPMTEAAAKQISDGGWNVAWAREKDLDVLAKYKVRALLNDPLLSPTTLNHPKKLKRLDSLIKRVRNHPALYMYFLGDEPELGKFKGMGRLVEYLREKDPTHAAYINLFPIYAKNKQLGTKGNEVTAYRKYLKEFIKTVRPSLLSYDNYQFAIDHDRNNYFLNLAMMRHAALDAGVNFLNIVQASTWRSSMRAPNESQMRYLVYSTLAYGAQAISYYVYYHPRHIPGIVTKEGKPTAVYHWLKPLNRDFLAIASQISNLQSLTVHHVGMIPPGAEPLPEGASFSFDPPIPAIKFNPGRRIQGALIGSFGPTAKGAPTHAIVVNLDYQEAQSLTLQGPAPIQQFDPITSKWNDVSADQLNLQLPPGGGVLVRVRR